MKYTVNVVGLEKLYTSVRMAELTPAVFRTNAFTVVVAVTDNDFVPTDESEDVVGVEPSSV